MTEHTPGPWTIHNNDKPLFGYWHIRQDPKDWDGMGYQAICTLPASGKNTHFGEMFHANARLISAAPDMLTALSEVEEYLDNRADVDDGIPNDAMRLLVEVRAAIAKATSPAHGSKAI